MHVACLMCSLPLVPSFMYSVCVVKLFPGIDPNSRACWLPMPMLQTCFNPSWVIIGAMMSFHVQSWWDDGCVQRGPVHVQSDMHVLLASGL